PPRRTQTTGPIRWSSGASSSPTSEPPGRPVGRAGPFLIGRARMRALGIDCGQARVGVAVSDEDRCLALPLTTVQRLPSRAETGKAVLRCLESREVDTLVVGLPLTLDGREGTSARHARALGDAIGVALGLEPIYWDERLTTSEAERSLRASGLD